MERYRCACFTLNNWTEEELTNLENIKYQYMIIGKEKGKEGTPHLQGYIEFDKRKSMKQLKKINNRIHWERRKGTQFQAISYCMKEKDFKEYGEKKIQGKRNDLTKARELVKKKGMRALLDQDICPNNQEIRVCEKYLTYCEETRKEKPEVIWIYGRSGIGKTRLAHELGGNDIYMKDESIWWDGYDRHETVIIDDFRGKHMNFTYLLKLLDRYEMRVQVKGGYRQILAKKIIITSIKAPELAYSFGMDEEPKEQLLRRIDKIYKENFFNQLEICSQKSG